MTAHVGLNCVFLVPGETGGMETYARGLAQGLLGEGARVTAFVSRELHEEHPGALPAGVERVLVPVRARSRPQWVLGEQALLPGAARRAGVDVLHSLASTAPARGPGRRVVTVHDLHFATVGEAHAWPLGLGMRVLVPLAARRSHRVIAVSEATAHDLERLLGVPRSRIDVVPSGVAASRPAPARAVAALRERLALPAGRPVVLALAAKRPHKNLPGLLRALAGVPADGRPVCVLPGPPTPHEAELRTLAAALGVAGDVRLCGWLPEADLEALWACADVLALPSFAEGFGLPVLEAMARGVPVVCSDRGALPEVAGDAAVLVDPADHRALAAALRRVLADDALRARLVAAGRARAAGFTWQRTARATLEAYARA